MNHHMIRVETYHGPETVQLTGRVDFASVEVFRRGKTEFVPKSRVLPEDQRRFPVEGKWRTEEEGGYFFMPEERAFTCEDKRVVWLANRVWRRLPAVERQVLHALETRVTDTDQTSFAGRYLLGSTFNAN